MAAPGLTYYPDDRPGIMRERRGRGFSYIAPDGTRIARGAERRRIEALAVPPAYEGVWISPLTDGHLQATGRDDRSRKQYRYHPDWTEHQARLKFAQLQDLVGALPGLRRWIAEGLRGEVGSQETAIAAVLALIDRAALRVGHPDYVQENGTFGATTLRTHHVEVEGGRASLSYPGKGGAKVEKDLWSPRLAEVLEAAQDLPGADLLGWVDASGDAHPVRSEQVNEVLAARCGEGVTAKTLRTWSGTLAAFEVALAAETRLTKREMAEAAAKRLHNTPAIAQRSYIHPDVMALSDLQAEDRQDRLSGLPEDTARGLRAGEAALGAFLQPRG